MRRTDTFHKIKSGIKLDNKEIKTREESLRRELQEIGRNIKQPEEPKINHTGEYQKWTNSFSRASVNW